MGATVGVVLLTRTVRKLIWISFVETRFMIRLCSIATILTHVENLKRLQRPSQPFLEEEYQLHGAAVLITMVATMDVTASAEAAIRIVRLVREATTQTFTVARPCMITRNTRVVEIICA